ncbi:MAG TPA: helix-turn-helix domain-containing protein [Pyrinomonadaceae bacterium]|nr:helix-turn-helix domain-containing protein [Pyrinomonadaceae bacterium]
MSQDFYRESIDSLSTLGFTDLEGAVYAYLVENSPATPYRVAQGIGRPVANTYKAVEALHKKGAVLIDETGNRMCQAVPPPELLSGLQRSFSDRYEQAARALSRLKPSAETERIFSLTSTEQVFDRCEQLIEQAESVVLVDAFPGIVDIIGPWLKAAAKRDVTVVLQTYKPTDIDGVEVIPYQAAELSLRRWPGQWMIVVVDGAEYLFAYMSGDAKVVYQAIWCGSAFLALPQHSNLAIAFRAAILEQFVREEAENSEMLVALKRTEQWLVLGTRGYNELAEKFSYAPIRPQG